MPSFYYVSDFAFILSLVSNICISRNRFPNFSKLFLFTEDIKSVAVHSPVTFAFHPYLGPIHSVCCSPHHRNLFLTAGADTIRLYNMLQVKLCGMISQILILSQRQSLACSRCDIGSIEDGHSKVYR